MLEFPRVGGRPHGAAGQAVRLLSTRRHCKRRLALAMIAARLLESCSKPVDRPTPLQEKAFRLLDVSYRL